MRKILLVLCATVLLVGCASVTAFRVQGARLENSETMYVVHFMPDNRHFERVIADDLRARGYNALSYGEKEDIPADVDILVTYVDHWHWDIVNYMLDIEIEFRQAKDGKKIASGKSYRPSLQRMSPKTMIKETLDKILEQE